MIKDVRVKNNHIRLGKIVTKIKFKKVKIGKFKNKSVLIESKVYCKVILWSFILQFTQYLKDIWVSFKWSKFVQIGVVIESYN